MMTEYEIQTKLVRYINLKYPDLLIVVSPAAGFKVSRGVAMKMIAMGYQKGTPDITVLKACQGYHGLCMELKTEKGVTSSEQTQYLTKAGKEGYFRTIPHSLDEATAILDWYLGN